MYCTLRAPRFLVWWRLLICSTKQPVVSLSSLVLSLSSSSPTSVVTSSTGRYLWKVSSCSSWYSVDSCSFSFWSVATLSSYAASICFCRSRSSRCCLAASARTFSMASCFSLVYPSATSFTIARICSLRARSFCSIPALSRSSSCFKSFASFSLSRAFSASSCCCTARLCSTPSFSAANSLRSCSMRRSCAPFCCRSCSRTASSSRAIASRACCSIASRSAYWSLSSCALAASSSRSFLSFSASCTERSRSRACSSLCILFASATSCSSSFFRRKTTTVRNSFFFAHCSFFHPLYTCSCTHSDLISAFSFAAASSVLPSPRRRTTSSRSMPHVSRKAFALSQPEWSFSKTRTARPLKGPR
mmetsp:Transcript_11171/g.36894  ORF Transcript_11171/g.36894 Transcript_11171/m.36894 type:complete len:360 (+) Transcript_11171:865-1944(+)